AFGFEVNPEIPCCGGDVDVAVVWEYVSCRESDSCGVHRVRGRRVATARERRNWAKKKGHRSGPNKLGSHDSSDSISFSDCFCSQRRSTSFANQDSYGSPIRPPKIAVHYASTAKARQLRQDAHSQASHAH